VSRGYIPRIFVGRSGKVCQDFALSAQRVSTQNLGTALEDRSNRGPQTGQKTADTFAPLKNEERRVDGSYAVILDPAATRLMNVVTHECIHAYKMYDKDDDEVILYYHAETRLATPYSTGLPVSFRISIRIYLIVLFSTGKK